MNELRNVTMVEIKMIAEPPLNKVI